MCTNQRKEGKSKRERERGRVAGLLLGNGPVDMHPDTPIDCCVEVFEKFEARGRRIKVKVLLLVKGEPAETELAAHKSRLQQTRGAGEGAKPRSKVKKRTTPSDSSSRVNNVPLVAHINVAGLLVEEAELGLFQSRLRVVGLLLAF